MHDALPSVAQAVQLDAILGAVGGELVYLRAAQWLLNGQVLVAGGHVVVGRGEDARRAEQRQVAGFELVERLRAGHLVDEVPVDIHDIQAAGRGFHHVRFPDFIE